MLFLHGSPLYIPAAKHYNVQRNQSKERNGNILSRQGEAAYQYFLRGYNCSQSVVAAFAPQLGLTEELALRLSSGFGAGIGRMREVCGAFCGVVTVISLVYADPADPQDKSRIYALVQEAAQMYRQRNGGDSIICRELLAKAACSLPRAPRRRPAPRGITTSAPARSCAACVRICVRNLLQPIRKGGTWIGRSNRRIGWN